MEDRSRARPLEPRPLLPRVGPPQGLGDVRGRDSDGRATLCGPAFEPGRTGPASCLGYGWRVAVVMPALDHHDKTLPQVPEAGNSKETARTLVEMDHRCEQGEKKGGRKTSHQSHAY